MRLFVLGAGAVFAVALTVPISTASSPTPQPKPRWITKVEITEYYPAPERWFTGRKMRAPGIPGRHRVDWLYSSSGVAMEGDGAGLDGRRYHLAASGSIPWVRADGKPTAPRKQGGWTHGWPFWRAGGWRNAAKEVTFPLDGGGWYKGRGVRYIEPKTVEFAVGPSLPLTPWKSIAVDPQLIPLGSRVFVPAYCATRGRAWFVAEDTGAAIKRRHIDVYRSAPKERDGASVYENERIFVVPPGAKMPKSKPTCAE